MNRAEYQKHIDQDFLLWWDTHFDPVWDETTTKVAKSFAKLAWIESAKTTRFSAPKCPECGGDAPRNICTNCRKRGL